MHSTAQHNIRDTLGSSQNAQLSSNFYHAPGAAMGPYNLTNPTMQAATKDSTLWSDEFLSPEPDEVWSTPAQLDARLSPSR